MQVPLEIAFHNYPQSDSIEDHIRQRVAKLDRLYRGLNSCRVRVDRPARDANDTTPPVVHIELGVARGGELVVSHDPGKLQRQYQSPDIRNAVNTAFHLAERRLVEYKNKRQRRTRVPRHDEANQFLGTVTDLPLGEDHGFLLTKEGGTLYFHRNSLLSGSFEQLLVGDEVHYVEDVGDTGPIATKVRPRGH